MSKMFGLVLAFSAKEELTGMSRAARKIGTMPEIFMAQTWRARRAKVPPLSPDPRYRKSRRRSPA